MRFCRLSVQPVPPADPRVPPASDLPGELDFLSSLLNENGMFVFDVPAGSTSSHPMHLNHNLDVMAYMKNKKLEDKRGIMLRLPFRKEEKYVFRMLFLTGNPLPGKTG